MKKSIMLVAFVVLSLIVWGLFGDNIRGLFGASRYSMLPSAYNPSWLVRDGSSATFYRVSVDGETVLDSRTGLSWQRSTSERALSWAEAKDYCRSSPIAGGSWRLPSENELLGIVDDGFRPTLDPKAFPNADAGPYPPRYFFWSSTPVVGNALSRWMVVFDLGDRHQQSSPDSSGLIRCVRSATSPKADKGT